MTPCIPPLAPFSTHKVKKSCGGNCSGQIQGLHEDAKR
nr:MAG TPA: hypothetical protein [Caudoviricetes sp.]